MMEIRSNATPGWSLSSSAPGRSLKMGPMAASSLPNSVISRSASSNNMADFEEIGLGEDEVRAPVFRRASTTMTAVTMPPSAAAALKSTRDLVAPQRPTLQTIHSLPAPAADDASNNFLRLPVKSSRSKRSSSPRRLKTQGLPGVPASSQNLSPTPPSPGARTSSNHSLPSRTRSSTSPSPKPFRPFLRQNTWQTGPRKTVEQMEKECDDDSGDDVPDDAVFWNVPLSPRAGRTLPSASPSPDRLSRASDSRRSSVINSTTSRSSSPLRASASTASLPTSLSSDAPESYRGRLRLRGKSWSDVIHELGDEAKDLTEALERHADEELEQEERRLQQNVANARRSTSPSKSATSTDITALPPKQFINATIDPLPISKEKEAAMSRTRPSWLPPKNKQEEQRHLREYQEMMRQSLEAERKKSEKEKKDAANREMTRSSVHRVWDEKVLPNWDVMVADKSTRELWWRGISPKSRGVVWMKAFGNTLAVGPETFKIALSRAQQLEKDSEGKEKTTVTERNLVAIRKDVSETFPELKMFQPDCPLHQGLIDVLMAYNEYRKDIGYVFGLHGIAAHLCLNLSTVDSFITLANILNRPLPLSFYSQDESGMTRIYTLFLRAFAYKLPRLHQHIHVKLCLPPPLYLEPMLSTLFTLHIPVDISSRLLDVYAFEGDAFVIRAAIAVMTALEARLYGTKEEVVGLLGWGGEGVVREEWRLGSEDEFMMKVRAAGKEEVIYS